MIECHRYHLAIRCHERGYTLAQAWPCVVSRDGDMLLVDETHPSYPRKKLGLGDMIEAGLSAVGITKELVQRVANAVGIHDCGCGKRQAAANKIGTYLGLPPGSTAQG